MTGIEKKKNFVINTFYIVIVIAIFYLFFKYALGTILPIVFAAFVAMLLQRPVNFICKKTPLKRGLVSALLVIFSAFAFLGVLVLFFAWLLTEVKGFIQYLIIKFEDIPTLILTVEGYLTNLLSFLPEKACAAATSFVHEKLNGLMDGSTSFDASQLDISTLSGPVLGVLSVLKVIPTTLVSFVVGIIACCFMTADFQSLKRIVLGVFKEDTRDKIVRAKRLLFPSLGKYAKAYGMIMLITFSEISIGLFLLKLLNVYNGGYILIIGVLTAIVDIVPVLGTGTVVIPWAAYNLFVGNYSLAIGLLALYLIITVIRQIIEPKLVATQLGLPAFLIITSMFIGSQIFGVFGIFILPITVLTLKLLNDEGIIHILHYPKEKTEEDKS